MNLYRASEGRQRALVLAPDEKGAIQCLTRGSDSVMAVRPTLELLATGINLTFSELPYNFCHSYSGGGYALMTWTEDKP